MDGRDPRPTPRRCPAAAGPYLTERTQSATVTGVTLATGHAGVAGSPGVRSSGPYTPAREVGGSLPLGPPRLSSFLRRLPSPAADSSSSPSSRRLCCARDWTSARAVEQYSCAHFRSLPDCVQPPDWTETRSPCCDDALESSATGKRRAALQEQDPRLLITVPAAGH